jgi:hypothetical protein
MFKKFSYENHLQRANNVMLSNNNAQWISRIFIIFQQEFCTTPFSGNQGPSIMKTFHSI